MLEQEKEKEQHRKSEEYQHGIHCQVGRKDFCPLCQSC